MSQIEDLAAVREVIERYVRGSAGEVELLRSVFHPNAMMTGYMQAQLLAGSPEPFFEAVENARPGTDYRAEITHVEVIGDTAVATLVESNLMGMDFVDHFHLVRELGEWLIVSKLFQVRG